MPSERGPLTGYRKRKENGSQPRGWGMPTILEENNNHLSKAAPGSWSSCPPYMSGCPQDTLTPPVSRTYKLPHNLPVTSRLCLLTALSLTTSDFLSSRLLDNFRICHSNSDSKIWSPLVGQMSCGSLCGVLHHSMAQSAKIDGDTTMEAGDWEHGHRLNPHSRKCL